MEKDKISQEETHLIAPCGIYCGGCDAFLGKSPRLAQELYRLLDGFNYADVWPTAVGEDLDRFSIFLEILKKIGGNQLCPGCWGRRADQVCPIKRCSQEKDFLTCAECEQLPCSPSEDELVNPLTSAAGFLRLISRRYQNWNIENLRKIKEIGYREFISEMQEKVKKGFLNCEVISKEMIFTEVAKKKRVRS